MCAVPPFGSRFFAACREAGPRRLRSLTETMKETFRRLIEEPSSSQEALRRKEARMTQLHTRQIPVLRVIGVLLLGLGVLLHNRFILGNLSWPSFWKYLVVSLIYSGLSWIVLARFYRPRQRFDLGLLFLTSDLVLFTAIIYLSGAEKSWLFFILLARVADQTTAGFRRALFFAHLVPFCYGGMLLVVVLVDGRTVHLGFSLAMLIFLYGAGVYLALTARPNDRRRRRAAEAVAIGRELIAQLRQQSEELQSAKARAESAYEAKSRFLNNSSHELRTPLNAVLGLLEMLRASELSAEQEEWVTQAQVGAERLLGTLDDIIDYSALEDADDESGGPPVESARVEVRQLVDAAAKWAREAPWASGLRISSEVAAGTPQSFFSDQRKLRRILGHLLTNAMKFSDAGTVRLAVRRQGETALRFEVRDSGSGIPAEQRAHIFKPFTQLDASTGRLHRGTGIGLALCRALVQRLGGEIGVEDGVDGGSVFWFTVEDHRIGAPSSGEATEAQLPQGIRVLVVEDDPINQKITYHQLIGLGVRGEVVGSGAEALERLATHRYDLILMDVQMPGMDGYVTTRELRSREGTGRRTPIIALTAHALPSDRRRCLEAGMDEHLSKPVSSESLEEVLLRWVPRPDDDRTLPLAGGGEGVILHAATLERLRELGDRHDRDLLGEMATIFLREIPDRVERLGAALSEKDLEEALYLAHSIKGSCNSLGVRELAELCLQMEESLRDESLEEATAFYPAARDALLAAREPLERLIT